MTDVKSAFDLGKKGKQAFQKKEYKKAAEMFQAAAQAYGQLGDMLNAAEMANNWSVAALQAGDAITALSAAEGTPDVFGEAGDVLREGMAWGNVAAAEEALGQLQSAMVHYEMSADLLKQTGDKEIRLPVMQALSALQLRTGNQLQALATMQAGLDGIKHPSPKQRFLKNLLKFPNRFLTNQIDQTSENMGSGDNDITS